MLTMARHAAKIDALLVSSAFDGEAYPGELLAKHTSYRIGGPARYFVCADSVCSLRQLVETCQDMGIAWTVIGKGTNLLISDDGYDGVVITLGRDFKNHHLDDEAGVLCTGAAVPLSAVVQEAFHRCLSGLEFAVGTPGSMGGAIRMNAGSGDTWIGGNVVSVTTMHPEKGMRRYAGPEISWGYRSTSFDSDEIILECEVSLKPADPFTLRDKMDRFLANRRRTQPLKLASCGSVFKNPEGHSAGALIDGLGLKGYAVGGAQVSDVHANFIVNVGNATASDVRAVMDHVRQSVREAHGIDLQPEVRFLGF